MTAPPLELWEELWAALEGELARHAPLEELAWLAKQGRWACEYARQASGPQLFDASAWASLVGARHGLELHLAPGFERWRWGDPVALEYLVVALCWRAYGLRAPALQLTGDSSEVWFQGPAYPDDLLLSGPLVSHLMGQLSARSGDSMKELFRCPCPVQQQDVSVPPVDLEALNRSCMDDAEFERELIETFTAEGRRQLASLALNYSSHILHSLKGSAGMVGAMRLAALLDEQEKALQKDQLPVLEGEFNRVVTFLQERLK